MIYAFCSSKTNDNIYTNKIEMIKLYIGENETDEVLYHADMLCFHLRDEKWIFYKDVYEKNKAILNTLNLDIIQTKRRGRSYPENIALNAAKVGNNIFCNSKYTDQNILNSGYNIINVKQGYAKCSICVVNDNSIITADKGIYRAAIENKVDSLLISVGQIDLNGYDYGFIGGASGLVDNRLIFFGNIKQHSDYEAIKHFCNERNVEIICLTDDKLYDYGGLLF